MRRPDDAPALSRITQPRQLGLLCYLALARPRGLHSRDTLIALLWPGHDDARGRRALRNALYGLRQELGTNAILSVGDHLVGLDPTFVSCDALDLEKTGSLPVDMLAMPVPLHGLHVDRAHAFDEWMSAERERLLELLRSQRRPHGALRSHGTPVVIRGPHSHDAAAMYARGHFLFLRTVHGGQAAELLRSRDYFERALAIDPTFAPALAGLSNFYAVAARRGVLTPFRDTFARAIALSHQALAMDETLAIPHVHFAVQALYLDDDWERAEREFATAVAKDPDYAEGRRFYGVWLGLAGRHAEALGEMEEAARLEPDIPHMLSSVAAARLAVGDRVGAESVLRRTLDLDPHHPPARARLLQLLEDDGRYEEALAERRRAPAVPGAEDFALAYGAEGGEGYQRVLHERLSDEAREIEARIIERQPTSPNDIFAPPIVRLVTVLARLGDQRRVRQWQLQGVAERLALARWFASIDQHRPAR